MGSLWFNMSVYWNVEKHSKNTVAFTYSFIFLFLVKNTKRYEMRNQTSNDYTSK